MSIVQLRIHHSFFADYQAHLSFFPTQTFLDDIIGGREKWRPWTKSTEDPFVRSFSAKFAFHSHPAYPRWPGLNCARIGKMITAVLSEAWAKLRDWASVAGRGRLLLSGSVAHASLKTAVLLL